MSAMTARLPPLASGAWPGIGHTLAFLRDPLALLSRGHAEHGCAFRLNLGGRTAVVLLGQANSREFFAATDRELSIRAGYPMFLRMFGRDFYLFAEQDGYLAQRNLILPRFSPHQLDFYAAVMVERTEKLIDRMGESGELDLVHDLGPLVMDIAADCFLGNDFSAHVRDFFPRFRAFSAGMDPVTPGWLPVPHLIRSRLAGRSLRTDLTEMIRQRRASGTGNVDFLQVLSDARFDNGQPVPVDIVAKLALLLVWAGHETTTGQLAWALIDLVSHPAELARVRGEHDQLLPPGHPHTSQAFDRLRLLNQALHETERLHPVAYLMARRASINLTIGEHRIPAGAMVFICPTLTHRLATDYPNPHMFLPDRWQRAGQRNSDLIGFGGGIHRCLGVHFAYLEMKVITTLLLQRFDLVLLDNPQPVRGSHTKWPTTPCRVRYARRTMPP